MMVLDGMLGTRILFDSLGGLAAVFRVEEKRWRVEDYDAVSEEGD